MLQKDIRDSMAEVSALAGDIGGGEPVERPYHEVEIARLFDRCRNMFDGACVLLEHGFVQEATIFCRPLFTDSLVLAELAAANTDRRIEILVGRSLADFADVEGIVREMRARGDNVEANLEHMAERRRRIEGYAQRHGVGTRHWALDVKKLADSHGRGVEYSGYRMSSHFVHGSAAITEHRSSLGDDDVMLVGGPAVDVDVWELPSALFAAYSTLLACRATCQLLGFPEPAGLGPLVKRIEAIQNADRTDGDDVGERPA